MSGYLKKLYLARNAGFRAGRAGVGSHICPHKRWSGWLLEWLWIDGWVSGHVAHYNAMKKRLAQWEGWRNAK